MRFFTPKKVGIKRINKKLSLSLNFQVMNTAFLLCQAYAGELKMLLVLLSQGGGSSGAQITIDTWHLGRYS